MELLERRDIEQFAAQALPRINESKIEVVVIVQIGQNVVSALPKPLKGCCRLIQNLLLEQTQAHRIAKLGKTSPVLEIYCVERCLYYLCRGVLMWLSAG